MSVFDVGDLASLRHEVRVDGTLTDATVSLSVTAPDGTVSTPSVTHAGLGIYTATVPVTQAGPWVYVFTMSGAVVDVAVGTFSAQNPQTTVYATPDQVKGYINLNNAETDEQITDSIQTASRAIDKMCGRRFYADLTATARSYDVANLNRIDVDDFWTTTGLVVEGDYGGDGTFETAITSYEVRPLNGVVDGESGWPYNEIRAVNVTFPTQCLRSGVRVTAKWGWSSVPAAVKTACVILTEETLKLAREAPFGVAGYGAFGPIRVRDNPRVMAMLSPYIRYPVLVA